MNIHELIITAAIHSSITACPKCDVVLKPTSDYVHLGFNNQTIYVCPKCGRNYLIKS